MCMYISIMRREATSTLNFVRLSVGMSAYTIWANPFLEYLFLSSIMYNDKTMVERKFTGLENEVIWCKELEL